MKRMCALFGCGVLSICSLLACGELHAELPSSVLDACLSPALTEKTSGVRWQVMTRTQWENRPTRISERAEGTYAEQDGQAHPSAWISTTLALLMPPQTVQTPRPIQTLTLRATPSGVFPKTTLDFIFLDNAALPPYTIKLWNGRPALVAVDGNWYIIAGDPKTKVMQKAGKPLRTSLVLEGVSTERTAPMSASILVGEGALPPEQSK